MDERQVELVAANAHDWTTFGRYVLLEKIGTGGMAEIYRAKTFGAAGFEKEFAIKLILPSLVDDHEFVDMFINEAKIAVSLYHANVVQVFDLGQLEGQYYIAMEFVHGKDLLDLLARCAEMDVRLPLHLVLFITMEMLKGLDFAHRAKDAYGEDLNIIHRDVSPSNILISYAGDVKVGDFGVAKAAIQRNLTESGTLKGKVGYMSPEQVMGETIDARSDIFSAGIVFFEALSMSRLFAGGSDLDVMLRVRDANISKDLVKAGPLPSDLREIVERALARHREERYQTAGEFYQSLVDFCFRHDIKVGESNLSSFVRRVFAEEIEAEKDRRRADPHAPIASILSASGSDVSAGQVLPAGQAHSSDSVMETLTSPPPPPSGTMRYRYRAADGEVHGPVTLTGLVDLVRRIDEPEQGEVALVDADEGEGWRELQEISELSDVLAELEDKKPAAQGAAVFRTHQGVGGEESLPLDLSNTLADRDFAEERERRSSEVREALEATGADEGELTEGLAAMAVRRGSQLSVQEVEALREGYDSYEGELTRLSFPRIVARLHRSDGTGRLYLERGQAHKSIYFRDGEIILVDSNLEKELLGAFLLSRDIITQEQLEEGLDRLSEWGGRLGDALVATGAIPAHDIFRLLSEQMAEKLLQVFEWPDGRYGYFENQEPETHGYPLDVDCYDILVRGTRDRVTLEYLIGLYKDRMHTAMYLREPDPFDMDQLRLRANELRVANQFKSGMSFHELMRTLPPAQRDTVYRVVFLLHQTELLTFEVTIDQSQIDFPG